MLSRSASSTLLALVLVSLNACAVHHGAKTLPAARFVYSEALSRSWNEQQLLNLVRLKYRDTPVFLEISSVVTQYEISTDFGLSATVDWDGPPTEEATLDAELTLTESPTISYTPLQGEDFARRMLSAVPSEALFLLSQAGWSVERLLLCCVQRVNDLRNAPSAAGPTPDRAPRYEDFYRLAQELRTLQADDRLELRAKTTSKAKTGTKSKDQSGTTSQSSSSSTGSSTSSKSSSDDKSKDDAAKSTGLENYVLRLDLRGLKDEQRLSSELRTQLGLPKFDASKEILELEIGQTTTGKEGSINILGRSLLGIFYFLANGVQAPEEHRERGLVTITLDSDGKPFDWQRMTGRLLNVRSSRERPNDAFVKVYYRGYWYSIADNDLQSKTTFGLLTFLFTLQSSSGDGKTPILSLSAG